MDSLSFNPSMMSLNDLSSLSPMSNQAFGTYGAMLPEGMKQSITDQLPMGMINRDGQAFMGQQQPQMQAPQDNPMGNKMDAYKMIAQAVQGVGRGMQMPSGNTAQIIRDNNQFRFAGNPQQQMAQALRNRG